MITHLTGAIDDEMFMNLIDAVNATIEKNEPLRIYLRSTGGDICAMEAIISLINENKAFVELIGYGELFSAAFIIFFSVGCKKSILPHTVGMVHLAASNLTIDARGKHSPNEYNHFAMESLKETNSRFLKFLKTIEISEKEKLEITSGKDVYFLSKRMNEILNGKDKHNSGRAAKVRGKSGGIPTVSKGEHDSNEGKE